jgi:hypothetical protein
MKVFLSETLLEAIIEGYNKENKTNISKDDIDILELTDCGVYINGKAISWSSIHLQDM